MPRSLLPRLPALLLTLIGCSSFDLEELRELDKRTQVPYDTAAAEAVEIMRNEPCSDIASAARAASTATRGYHAAGYEAMDRLIEAAPSSWSVDRRAAASLEARDRVPMPTRWCRNDGERIAVLVDGRPLGSLALDLNAFSTCRVYLGTVAAALAEADRRCHEERKPQARAELLRAATAAEAAADQWETAGRLAREILAAGGPPTPEKLTHGFASALRAAAEATEAADDAALDALEELAQVGDGPAAWNDARHAFEQVIEQTPDVEPLDRASILADRGREAEAEVLVYDFLQRLDRQETAAVAAYVRLARAWRAAASDLAQAEQ